MKGISPWAATARKILAGTDLKELYQRQFENFTLRIVCSGDCLWIVAQKNKTDAYAFRLAYSANDLLDVKFQKVNEDKVLLSAKSIIGDFTIKIEFPEKHQPLFHYNVSLMPREPLSIPFWPRDIVCLGKETDSHMTIHVSQVGARSGLLYATGTSPNKGSLFYFQNLSALNEYCEQLQAPALNTVGGEWPEIGFSLPASNENKLSANKNFVISDAYVLLSTQQPANEFEQSKQFLDHLAQVYIHVSKPETSYRQWKTILKNNIQDLKHNPGCWSHVNGQTYLNAYISDYETPVEIMVQLAVLLPVLDYSKQNEEQLLFTEIIQDGLKNFYDPKLGTIVRWLPVQEDKLDGKEEHKKPRVMDSWYLYHPLINLSRLAIERKNKTAEKLFLDSLDFAMRVAHKFNYEWPVFYNMDTLEIIKAETKPGKGGEKDVPGLYAHVMLQAWELTGDVRYLDEAKKAALSLRGHGFNLFYQANNTAFSAGAMLRLWKETREEIYLNLSYLCLANVFKNVQLWECDYGYGKYYPTFFGVFPLNDADYTAVYEEQEVFSAFHDYLKRAEGEDILPSVSLLMAEFIRYILFRGVAYYPPNFKDGMLAEKSRTGEIDKKLWIPIEDLRDGFEQSGQVGQEVYGSGFACGLASMHYFPVPEECFTVYIDYPVSGFRKSKNSIRFSVKGDERMICRMMILPSEGKKLSGLEVKGNLQQEILPLKVKDKKNLEFLVHGNQKLEITWSEKEKTIRGKQNRKLNKSTSNN
jgi:hypothetical protein